MHVHLRMRFPVFFSLSCLEIASYNPLCIPLPVRVCVFYAQSLCVDSYVSASLPNSIMLGHIAGAGVFLYSLISKKRIEDLMN